MAAFDNLSNPSEYLAYWGKTYRNELLSNKQTGILKMKIKSK